MTIPYIEEVEINEKMKHKPVLISHGGVGSEYLTSLLRIRYPSLSFKNNFVHFPYPPKGPSYIIYLYGDIYNSILSQIERHPYNASKLHNNKKYPPISSLNDLFSIEKNDPFGIEGQIRNFFNHTIYGPIILLKYGFSEIFRNILISFTGNINFMRYKFKARNSNLNLLPEEKKEKLLDLYREINWIVEHSPTLLIRFPRLNYELSQKDIIYRKIIQNLPGRRQKHYLKINGYEFFNERDVPPHGYGQLRYRKKGELFFSVENFRDQSIFCDIKNGGVEDPRYIILKGELYIIMNGLDFEKKRNMYLYHFQRKKLIKLKIKGFLPKQIEKNWIPFIFKDELYFIYSIKEICILKVINIEQGICNVIKGDPTQYSRSYPYAGSTPLLLWNFPNYIGFLHSRNPYYTIPCIFNIEKMDFTKIGKKIIFRNQNTNIPFRRKIVQFPYDLRIIQNKVELSINFGDNLSVIYTISYVPFCKQFSN